MLLFRRLGLRQLRLFHITRRHYSPNQSGNDDANDNPPTMANLPGGGLGKLQNTREEVYFCKQQNELIMKLLKKYQNPDTVSTLTEEEKTDQKKLVDDYFSTCIHGSSSKSKNVHEEGYFYNEQIDLINRLRRKDEFSTEKGSEDDTKDTSES